jgi:ABC-2 type transport system permease protein
MAFFFSFALSQYTYDYNTYQAMINLQFQLKEKGHSMQLPEEQLQRPDFNFAVTQGFYFWLTFMLLFVLPLLTMRTFAEERRTGALELMLTYPVRDVSLVLGKFFACLTVFTVMLLLTLIFPHFINQNTAKASLEAGPLLLCYTGTFLIGGAFIGIGMFLSSLTRSQVLAAMYTFGVLFGFFFLWLLGFSEEALGETLAVFRNQEFLAFFKHLSIFGHNENFIRGLLDTRDIVYCINLTVVSLLLCWFSLGTRRWRT